MKTAEEVANLIAEWTKPVHGYTKEQIIVLIAEACMGWPYVWGGAGSYCTPNNRKSYANRSSCPEAESKVIVKKCQVLSGTKSYCNNCKWYPENKKTRFFDCRGFTRWLLAKVGISLMGGGASSQWNNASNWKVKGEIKDMPTDCVCCVFCQDGKKMSHTGMYVGNGVIIHCSGEVKKAKPTDRGWTHYAIPKGLEGGVEPVPGTDKPTIKKGSRGEAVKELQQILLNKGYDIGSSGIDGIFGTKTREAVIAFQQDHDIKADGIVGPATWVLLEEEDDPKKYTVTIPHLPAKKAEALLKEYPEATKTEEDA